MKVNKVLVVALSLLKSAPVIMSCLHGQQEEAALPFFLTVPSRFVSDTFPSTLLIPSLFSEPGCSFWLSVLLSCLLSCLEKFLTKSHAV